MIATAHYNTSLTHSIVTNKASPFFFFTQDCLCTKTKTTHLIYYYSVCVALFTTPGDKGAVMHDTALQLDTHFWISGHRLTIVTPV